MGSPHSNIIPIVFSVLSVSIQAQSFEVDHGGATGEFGVGSIATSSGHVLIGTRYLVDEKRHEAVVVRVSSTGVLQSTNALTIPGRVFIQDLHDAANGGIYIVGSVIQDGRVDHDAFVALLNANDMLVWTMVEDEPKDAQLFALDVLSDGSVVATGVKNTMLRHDMLVLRCGANGTLHWSITNGLALDEEGMDIVADGTGMLVTGRQTNFGGTSDAYFLRCDHSGAVQWTTSWGGVQDDAGLAITQRSDGNFIMAGYTESYGPTDVFGNRKRNIWMLAMNGVGDTLWTRAYGDTVDVHEAYDVLELSNGDILVGGERSYSGISDALVLRTSNSGTVQWQKLYHTGLIDRIVHLRSIATGFMASGWTVTDDAHQFLLLRKDAQGN